MALGAAGSDLRSRARPATCSKSRVQGAGHGTESNQFYVGENRMRTIVGLTLTFLVAAAASGQQTAQQGQAMTVDDYLDLVRTEIKKQRAQLVGQGMNLSADEAVVFWPIYKEYEHESTKLGDQRIALIRDFSNHFDNMAEDKARELAEMALSIEEQRTALKRKYFDRFSEAMSAITAARFLQVDNQVGMLIDLKIASELPLIK